MGAKSRSDIDPGLGFEKIPAFSAYLLNENFDEFEKQFDQLGGDARSLITDGIGLNTGMRNSILKWAEADAGSGTAQLLAGVSETCAAWEARTAARGEEVSERQATLFLNHLEKAVDYLQQADQLAPDNAEVCARMIRALMGLGAETGNAYEYFEAADRLEPRHFMSHMMMANFLTPKWRGSVEELHEFCDNQFRKHNSSVLVCLPLFALVEEWLYYSMVEDHAAKHEEFFKDSRLKEKIATLYRGYREEEPNALFIPYVYNYFAFHFFMIGDKAAAGELIKKIPGKMTVYPWAYIGIESNKELQQLCI